MTATYHAFLPGGQSAEIKDAPSTKRARTVFLDYLARNKYIKWDDRGEVRRHIKVNKVFPGEIEADVILDYNLVPGSAEAQVPIGKESAMRIVDEAGRPTDLEGRVRSEASSQVRKRDEVPDYGGELGGLVEAASYSPRRPEGLDVGVSRLKQEGSAEMGSTTIDRPVQIGEDVGVGRESRISGLARRPVAQPEESPVVAQAQQEGSVMTDTPIGRVSRSSGGM